MVFVIKVLMTLTAFFLIVLILLQRGRGGGLAGALGGMGGQSAFGSKAGDVFTRITSVLAIVWIVLCVGALKYFNTRSDLFGTQLGNAATPAEASIDDRTRGDSTTPASPDNSDVLPAETNSDGGDKGE